MISTACKCKPSLFTLNFAGGKATGQGGGASGQAARQGGEEAGQEGGQGAAVGQRWEQQEVREGHPISQQKRIFPVAILAM